ncbi:MAG: S-layer homology domain-containing protein, partial [Oscillospiraceae bacterium]|nr:S-layer homology domain-containing protein [Oscillospiraceae bacterium]
MMKTKRKIALLLIFILLLSSASPWAMAADKAEISAANSLYELGLFKGVSENKDGTPVYELDRVMNRSEAITMLIRLLGLEEAAAAGTWETPFTDLVSWAEPYVGCAYDRGLTKGVSETTFGSSDNVTAGQYMI